MGGGCVGVGGRKTMRVRLGPGCANGPYDCRMIFRLNLNVFPLPPSKPKLIGDEYHREKHKICITGPNIQGDIA
jgi:hypothetical protein